MSQIKKTYADLKAAIGALGLKSDDEVAVMSTIAQFWPNREELPIIMGAPLGTGRFAMADEKGGDKADE